MKIEDNKTLPPLGTSVLLQVEICNDMTDPLQHFEPHPNLVQGRRYLNGQGGYSYEITFTKRPKDFKVVAWQELPKPENLDL